MSNENKVNEGPAPDQLEEQDTDDSIRVDDRRHWTSGEDDVDDEVEVNPKTPSIIDEYRERAEAAEQKLLEYIDAFKRHKLEQDHVRERLRRDIDRRVEMKFGELVQPLLEIMDDLERSMLHIPPTPESEPLLRGVRMTHELFLATLEKFGVKKFAPDGEAFDPEVAEALRVDPVDSEEGTNRVTVTLKPGYKIGERVLRAAQVAVGRFTG